METRAIAGKPRSYAAQAATLFAAGLAVCACALATSGIQAAAWSLAATAACCLVFAAFSRTRRAEICQLASEIDEVLHTGRRTRFTDCREGDVAVLKNELTKMVERMVRLNDDLVAEKRALADALADVSHQVRTPLTSIGLLIPLIDRAPDAAQRRRRLRELETLVDRMSWLVTALLKMAKLDAGTLVVERRPVDAGRALQRALEPLAIPLDLKEISLVEEVEEGAGFEGDESWTAEALSNILKNCMEHTPRGGTIRAKVVDNAVSCTISVSDSGAGIAEEDLPHVFERFYRGRAASGADDGEPAGFGIGLSLAMELVSAQGGSLRASNRGEEGALFEMTFPKVTV